MSISNNSASLSHRPTGRNAKDNSGSVVLPIDVRFDTDFADAMAQMEMYNKHHYRPNTYLHKWWARRCGSTFRLIFKELVTENDKQDYYTAGGLAGKIVMDPMMGGGTTIHEAIRLGANVIGVDIDPIPVMQARASLATVPLQEIESAFIDLMQGLSVTLGELFTTTCPKCDLETPMRYMLYGLRRHCGCGPTILVDNLDLRFAQGKPIISLCAHCKGINQRFEVCSCDPDSEPTLIRTRHEQVCPRCQQTYHEEGDRPYYERYEPLVIVGHCREHGLFYKSPGKNDNFRIVGANERRKLLNLGPDNHYQIAYGPKSRDLQSRNIGDFRELFSSRQLLYLAESIKRLPQYPEGVRLNLALLISTSLEFNSMLCGYKGARRGDRAGAIRHAFSFHAYTFPYTAVENNILFPQKASGTLLKLFHDRIRRARQWAESPRERHISPEKKFVAIVGELDQGNEVKAAADLVGGNRQFFIHQGTATKLPVGDNMVDFVVTDPPYFDSVQYSDLAAFFRVWLQKLMPTGGKWDYDPAGAAVNPHDHQVEQYTQVLSGIFAECRRVLQPEWGRLIFTFHHWNPQGWAELSIALQRARFQLINRYVVQSENPVSVHITNVSALKHDAILVLAPAGSVTTPEWEKPNTIDKMDSRQFCQDCATMLGWMLTAGLNENDIRLEWKQYLGRN